MAVEFNQLLYHTAKAREKNCAYVEELRKVRSVPRNPHSARSLMHSSLPQRIINIEDTLSHDLDIIFSASLAGVTSGSSSVATSSAPKSKAVADLTECLRIYDSLAKWDVAEDVIRQDVVQPFIRKVCLTAVAVTCSLYLCPDHYLWRPECVSIALSATDSFG